jgi:hypothetical protein
MNGGLPIRRRDGLVEQGSEPAGGSRSRRRPREETTTTTPGRLLGAAEMSYRCAGTTAKGRPCQNTELWWEVASPVSAFWAATSSAAALRIGRCCDHERGALAVDGRRLRCRSALGDRPGAGHRGRDGSVAWAIPAGKGPHHGVCEVPHDAATDVAYGVVGLVYLILGFGLQALGTLGVGASAQDCPAALPAAVATLAIGALLAYGVHRLIYSLWLPRAEAQAQRR